MEGLKFRNSHSIQIQVRTLQLKVSSLLTGLLSQWGGTTACGISWKYVPLPWFL